MSTVAAKPKSLGELIQYHRQKKDISLNKLQELVGIDKGSLSRIENGEVKRPDFQMILSISTALDIPCDDIVELYIEIGHKANVMYSILLKVLEISIPSSLVIKIATKFLESPKENSEDLVEKLYQTTDSVKDTSIKLSLYKLIIDYSRDHGIMFYIAKGLMQEYLIERNDFSKLNGTYQKGRYILKYAHCLSVEERVNLHYRLGVHAYNLCCFEESIALCEKVIDEDPTKSILSAEAHGIICDSYYFLGKYDMCEEYMIRYSEFPFPFIKDNVKVTTAVLYAKKGNVDLAIEQLQECLKSCGQNSLLHIINQLMLLYLQNDNLSAIEELLNYEEKIISIPYTSPFKQLEVAHYYEIKGNYYISLGSTEEGIDCFFKSALRYSRVNAVKKERECINLVVSLHITSNEGMSIANLKKLQILYNQCNEQEEEHEQTVN
ncbi:helix-turn-helix domain-containing protein [Paenibacillus profundus]|uniref:Helix-turn-helix domain-containing protein n=1 Tax=Paenibacillus profundus TaxID=1173085 RepID=A0ABS8YMW9_9BACL|nr:helix-turn-helix transcriptional regulator [Paenibacillus profundus]MCE5171652.1 helix-turn-helix domain-containing protein [Paenibacillus profundus]